MVIPMSEARFASWSAAESPVTIEYSLVVIEEIRHEVSEGFQKLSRGGVEVGGILYGTREGRTVRLLAIRPINCEHARGPAFQLSDSDKAALEEELERNTEDQRLADLTCLGWFVSHTRSEVMLSESDLEIYEKYFNDPWQVTLVIRPGRGGSMRAGFFVREHDGTVRSESSYLEFNFPDRLAGVLDRPVRPDRPSAARAHTVYFRESAAAPVRRETPLPQAQLPAPQFIPPPAPRPKWPWLLAWGVVVVAIAVLAVRYFVLTPGAEPLDLSVLDHDGQLQVSWDQKAKPVSSAVRGLLVVTDGQTPRTIQLSQQDLERGNYSYKRASDDVEVRMSVEDASGLKTDSKTTTFLGAAPVKPADDAQVKALQQERDDLKAQVEQLKSENAAQAQQILQLQRNLKILEARLGVQ
jgi:proteasome lid subunit RPN8/RPN11/cell division protein FtsB